VQKKKKKKKKKKKSILRYPHRFALGGSPPANTPHGDR
jgi:hypothetical protein